MNGEALAYAKPPASQNRPTGRLGAATASPRLRVRPRAAGGGVSVSKGLTGWHHCVGPLTPGPLEAGSTIAS